MKVTVFSTPTCPWCKKVKTFLADRGIVFDDVDVSADSQAAALMTQKSGQMGVPVTLVRDENGGESIVIGYDEKQLSKLLNV